MAGGSGGAPYPVGSATGGGILYSDGSVRYQSITIGSHGYSNIHFGGGGGSSRPGGSTPQEEAQQPSDVQVTQKTLAQNATTSTNVSSPSLVPTAYSGSSASDSQNIQFIGGAQPMSPNEIVNARARAVYGESNQQPSGSSLFQQRLASGQIMSNSFLASSLAGIKGYSGPMSIKGQGVITYTPPQQAQTSPYTTETFQQGFIKTLPGSVAGTLAVGAGLALLPEGVTTPIGAGLTILGTGLLAAKTQQAFQAPANERAGRFGEISGEIGGLALGGSILGSAKSFSLPNVREPILLESFNAKDIQNEIGIYNTKFEAGLTSVTGKPNIEIKTLGEFTGENNVVSVRQINEPIARFGETPKGGGLIDTNLDFGTRQTIVAQSGVRVYGESKSINPLAESSRTLNVGLVESASKTLLQQDIFVGTPGRTNFISPELYPSSYPKFVVQEPTTGLYGYAGFQGENLKFVASGKIEGLGFEPTTRSLKFRVSEPESGFDIIRGGKVGTSFNKIDINSDNIGIQSAMQSQLGFTQASISQSPQFGFPTIVGGSGGFAGESAYAFGSLVRGFHESFGGITGNAILEGENMNVPRLNNLGISRPLDINLFALGQGQSNLPIINTKNTFGTIQFPNPQPRQEFVPVQFQSQISLSSGLQNLDFGLGLPQQQRQRMFSPLDFGFNFPGGRGFNFGFPLEIPGLGGSGGERGRVTKGRKFRRTPSLIAIELGLMGKPNKKLEQTGLFFRPITKSQRGVSKRNRMKLI